MLEWRNKGSHPTRPALTDSLVADLALTLRCLLLGGTVGLSLQWGRRVWQLDTVDSLDMESTLSRWGILPVGMPRPSFTGSSFQPAHTWLGLLPKIKPARLQDICRKVEWVRPHIGHTWELLAQATGHGACYLAKAYISMVAQTLRSDNRTRLAHLRGDAIPDSKPLFQSWCLNARFARKNDPRV